MTAGELEKYLLTMAAGGRVANSILIDGVTCDADRAPAEAFVRKLMGSLDHPDVIRIEHEKENVISPKELRAQVCDNVVLRPFARQYKVYFIEMDLIGPQGQNVLLKTLEEPPEYAVFIMFTRAAEMLLETVRSRCLILTLGESGRAGGADAEILAQVRGAARELLSAGPAGTLKISKELIAINDAGKATIDEIFDIIKGTYADMLVSAARGGSSGPDQRAMLLAIDAVSEAQERVNITVNKNLALGDMTNKIRLAMCAGK